jgi:hypothetical protein
MFVFGWGKEVLRSSNRDRYFKNLSFENDWDPLLISDFQVRSRCPRPVISATHRSSDRALMITANSSQIAKFLIA